MVVGEIVGVVRDVAGGGSEATRWRRGVFIFPLVLTAAAAGAPWMSSSSSKSVAGVACWCPSLRQFAMMLRPQAPQSCHAPPPPPIVVVEILHCQPEPHATVAGEAEGGSGTPARRGAAPPPPTGASRHRNRGREGTPCRHHVSFSFFNYTVTQSLTARMHTHSYEYTWRTDVSLSTRTSSPL
jgi:hypothetical protein